MKEFKISVQQMEEAYHYMNDSESIIVNGFKESGIFNAVASSLSLTLESDVSQTIPSLTVISNDHAVLIVMSSV